MNKRKTKTTKLFNYIKIILEAFAYSANAGACFEFIKHRQGMKEGWEGEGERENSVWQGSTATPEGKFLSSDKPSRGSANWMGLLRKIQTRT